MRRTRNSASAQPGEARVPQLMAGQVPARRRARQDFIKAGRCQRPASARALG
jgi:hypothetical protein